MNTKPLVSIAMATYNGANYISQQLGSILQQTWTNIELIITDDASSDGTMVILEDFKSKFDCIKLFRNPVNLGITETFELSIRQCKGEYIAISDQDDIWNLNKIEVLMNAIKDEDAVYSDSELVDKNGQSMHTLISSLINLRSFYSGAPFLMGLCLPGHTMIMQADFAKYILPFPKVVIYDRWISFCAAANNGIRYIDMPLVKYRQHETNSFGVKRNNKRKIRKTKKQQYYTKLQELMACENAPIRDPETRELLHEMITRYTDKPSLSRSFFFFKNRNKLLVIKKRTGFKKILYCLKMFFKANY